MQHLLLLEAYQPDVQLLLSPPSLPAKPFPSGRRTGSRFAITTSCQRHYTANQLWLSSNLFADHEQSEEFQEISPRRRALWTGLTLSGRILSELLILHSISRHDIKCSAHFNISGCCVDTRSGDQLSRSYDCCIDSCKHRHLDKAVTLRSFTNGDVHRKVRSSTTTHLSTAIPHRIAVIYSVDHSRLSHVRYLPLNLHIVPASR